jgi:hypothetical protein
VKRVIAGLLGTMVLGTALWLAVPAGAKDFRPGDIRVCTGRTCVVLRDQKVLNTLANFYYRRAQVPKVTTAPASRAPYVELRFRNGYVTGIAAGAHYDHFLSYGVNLDQFRARTWYAIPDRVSAALAQLAAQLHPRPLPSDVLNRSH